MSHTGARDAQSLSAHQHDVLATQQLLGNLGSQTAHHVVAAVHYNHLLEHS